MLNHTVAKIRRRSSENEFSHTRIAMRYLKRDE